MKGKDCVAIACDKRLGLQMQTVAVDFEKIFELAPTTFIGLAGLATDVQTVYVFLSWVSFSIITVLTYQV